VQEVSTTIQKTAAEIFLIFKTLNGLKSVLIAAHAMKRCGNFIVLGCYKF
jgi:hypothetical protein